MPDHSCDQEPDVMRAVAAGQWDQRLQAHVESCTHCRDVLRVSRLLQTVAAATKPQLPPAAFVWWQSRLHNRQAALRRVNRLFAITRIVTVSVSMTALVGWIIWRWSEVVEGIKGDLSSFSGWSPSSFGSYAPVLVYASVALLCINLLLTIRVVLTNLKSK